MAGSSPSCDFTAALLLIPAQGGAPAPGHLGTTRSPSHGPPVAPALLHTGPDITAAGYTAGLSSDSRLAQLVPGFLAAAHPGLPDQAVPRGHTHRPGGEHRWTLHPALHREDTAEKGPSTQGGSSLGPRRGKQAWQPRHLTVPFSCDGAPDHRVPQRCSVVGSEHRGSWPQPLPSQGSHICATGSGQVPGKEAWSLPSSLGPGQSEAGQLRPEAHGTR